MKKGNFDLTGKAIDCRGLPEMGDAGKEIFRALKVACGNKESPFCAYSRLVNDGRSYLELSRPSSLLMCTMIAMGSVVVQPSDVLGQDAIDAAMDGATIVFEGDVTPSGKIARYWSDEARKKANLISPLSSPLNENIIAYKLLEEKQPTFTTTSPVQQMHEQLGMSKPAFDRALAESLKHESPSIQSRVLAEKMGFKELCPVCSPKDWQDREAETYDELRESHLELVRENMLLVKENEEKDKEIELLKQRIKDMHSALNDIESMADKIKVSANV